MCLEKELNWNNLSQISLCKLIVWKLYSFAFMFCKNFICWIVGFFVSWIYIYYRSIFLNVRVRFNMNENKIANNNPLEILGKKIFYFIVWSLTVTIAVIITRKSTEFSRVERKLKINKAIFFLRIAFVVVLLMFLYETWSIKWSLITSNFLAQRNDKKPDDSYFQKNSKAIENETTNKYCLEQDHPHTIRMIQMDSILWVGFEPKSDFQLCAHYLSNTSWNEEQN